MVKPLNILHISTHDSYGAGTAALNLHEALLGAGMNSNFLCLHKQRSAPNVWQYPLKKSTYTERIRRKFGLFPTRTEKIAKKINQLGGQFEIFTSPYSGFNLHQHEMVASADVINLHWIANFLDWKSFFSKVDKPVVWTLHDKNPTLGGFHLLIDKLRNPHLLPLENELSNWKGFALSRKAKLTVVSPSKSLLRYSQESTTFQGREHFHIPNSVDFTKFRPVDKAAARNIFNLPPNKKIVLFLNTESYHKGSQFVCNLPTEDLTSLHFVALGNSLQRPSTEWSYIPCLHDERLLSILYSAADLFLVPSLEDNLPNMMLESLACGTPVLGFRTGGIEEAIQPYFNGLLVPENTGEALFTALNELNCSWPSFDGNRIQYFARKHFSPLLQAQRYMNIYHHVLNG